MRESPKLVILFLAIVAYVTFAVGEVSGFSGIISTIFASVLLGYYARPHLDHHGSLLSTFFLKQLAHMADICVFLLAGFCVVNLQFEAMSFCLCAAGACLLGRAMGVFPLGVLANAIKSAKGRYYRLDEEDWHLLSKEHLFMMWHAGLRGSIALNLSMQLGPWVDTLDGDGTLSVLQGSTFLIVCLFMLIFGGSTQYFLTRLEIPMGENADFEKLYRTNQKLPTSEFWQWLDQSIMEPFFVGSHVMTSGSRRSVLRRGKDLDILDILED
jgi:NhaP-type Na+/H+ or K+/H+ antiporter